MSTEKLTALESAVLEMLLAGPEAEFVTLRQQVAQAGVLVRELSGVGFFCRFRLPVTIARISGSPDFELSDVEAEIPELRHGAGFVLFVRGGQIDMLEGFAYDERWPDNIEDFTLRYQQQPRRLPLVLERRLSRG